MSSLYPVFFISSLKNLESKIVLYWNLLHLEDSIEKS